MRDFGSGWDGLKEYAIKVGVCTVDDTDDAAASKIKLVVQGTLPEQEEVEVDESGTDSDSETEA